MFIALLTSFLVLGVVTDCLSIWMKIRVNERLPEGRRLTWWSRNYSQVNKLYEEQNPDSILPDLNRGGTVLVLALFVTIVGVGMVSGR